MPREPDFEARIRATQKAAEQRLDRSALLGKPVGDAEAWCEAHGFPVLVERGGATQLSFMPGRVRLWAKDGVVTEVHLG